jgi:hypothetical protein
MKISMSGEWRLEDCAIDGDQDAEIRFRILQQLDSTV